MSSSDDHVKRNQESWAKAAAEYVDNGRRNWTDNAPQWGIWGVPESDVGALPSELEGKDVIELGCGTGYISSWLARRGARPVALDLTTEQLDSARMFQKEFDLYFPIVQANAELVPLKDESFDIAISEYGASIWCDPYKWIPEASRLIRAGGELVYLVNGMILMMCMNELDSEGPAGPILKRPYFGMHRLEWPDDDGVNFQIGYGAWIRLLRANGFEVTDMIEVRPIDTAETTYPFVDNAWARQWPSEEIWKAVKKG
jgi:SAM-dependent methyltransferase